MVSLFVIALTAAACKSVHQAGVSQDAIPQEIINGNSKVLFTEINFENTVSKNTAKVHNNSARKYLNQKMNNKAIFISEGDLNNALYSDKNIYRFVLMNRITAEVNKKYVTENTRRQVAEADTYITEFYFLDRLTGKEYPHVKGTTMPLYMFKAIVDKVSS